MAPCRHGGAGRRYGGHRPQKGYYQGCEEGSSHQRTGDGPGKQAAEPGTSRGTEHEKEITIAKREARKRASRRSPARNDKERFTRTRGRSLPQELGLFRPVTPVRSYRRDRLNLQRGMIGNPPWRSSTAFPSRPPNRTAKPTMSVHYERQGVVLVTKTIKWPRRPSGRRRRLGRTSGGLFSRLWGKDAFLTKEEVGLYLCDLQRF